MALRGRPPFPGPDRGSRVGCVAHDPRVSGHVAHNPQTTAAGPRGTWPTTPILRGLWATTPKRWGHAARRVPAATGHTVNVASITRRRADRPGRLRDLTKMVLTIRVPLSGCCGGVLRVAGEAAG